MTDYRYELLALERMINEKKGYSQVLLSLQKEEKISQKRFSLLKENLHTLFRHYFTLSFECMNILSVKKNSREFFLALIALTLLRYSKEEKDVILEDYQDTFSRCRLSGNPSLNAAKMEEASASAFVIPEEVKSNKILYHSLLLQVPPFLLKKLSSEMGEQKAIEVLSEYRKKATTYYLLLNDDAPIKDFLPLPDKMKLVYEGEEKDIRKCRYVSEHAYSLLPIPNLEAKVLMMGNMHSDSFIPIAKRLSYVERASLTVAFEEEKKEKKAQALLPNYEGVNTISSPLYLLKTYLPFSSYDDVIVLGKSSECGRRKAYLFPALEEEDLLSSILSMKAQLKEAAPFVRKGGTLLFVQHSLLKEEGEMVIQDFLASNKDFIIVEEKQIYATESQAESGYYCLLKRTQND